MGAGVPSRRSRAGFSGWRSEVNQMYMIIYALVEASAQHDTLVEGKAVFDRLVGANPYSYLMASTAMDN